MRVLRAVYIEPCRSSDAPMSLRLVYPLDRSVDGHGVCKDGIWRIRTSGTPDRFLRLYKGSESVRNLLHKYSFRDKRGCSYTRKHTAALETAQDNAKRVGAHLSSRTTHRLRTLRPQAVRRLFARSLPNGKPAVPCFETFRTIGLPQRTVGSGVCWWGSVLWVVRVPPKMRALVDAAVATCPSPVAHELRERLPKVFDEPREARMLHDRLHALHNIGDKPGIPETEEGQNGYTQMCMIAKVIGLRGITLEAPEMNDITDYPLVSKFVDMGPLERPDGSGAAFLGVRVGRAPWRPKLTLEHDGREWELQGCFLGSEFCGHQTAIARACPGTWAHYDSDACRLGIGPYSWQSSDQDWWTTLEHVMAYSNSTSMTKFCDFAPQNRHVFTVTRDLLGAHGVHDADVGLTEHDQAHSLNVDWVYAPRY